MGVLQRCKRFGERENKQTVVLTSWSHQIYFHNFKKVFFCDIIRRYIYAPVTRILKTSNFFSLSFVEYQSRNCWDLPSYRMFMSFILHILGPLYKYILSTASRSWFFSSIIFFITLFLIYFLRLGEMYVDFIKFCGFYFQSSGTYPKITRLTYISFNLKECMSVVKDVMCHYHYSCEGTNWDHDLTWLQCLNGNDLNLYAWQSTALGRAPT